MKYIENIVIRLLRNVKVGVVYILKVVRLNVMLVVVLSVVFEEILIMLVFVSGLLKIVCISIFEMVRVVLMRSLSMMCGICRLKIMLWLVVVFGV